MEEELGYTPLPSINGSIACLTCGCGSHDTLSMDALLAVGFGDCNVTCDDRFVYSESSTKEGEWWVGHNAEAAAAADPKHDWRIHFYAPLYEAHYQRQGKEHWVLYEKGQGFA